MKVSLLVKRRKDRSGPQPVYVRLSHLGAEARVALGVKLHPKHWNPRRQEVRASALDADGLNALLNERLATAQRVARDLVLERGAKVSITEGPGDSGWASAVNMCKQSPGRWPGPFKSALTGLSSRFERPGGQAQNLATQCAK